MSWTDKQAIRVMNYFREKYKIKILVETGTYKGVNALIHSKTFDMVYTCENNLEYFNHCQNKLKDINNIEVWKEHSPYMLKDWRHKDTLLFYLDAHFYDPTLPKDKRFVVLDELKALKGQKNCVIVIHDFDNNLGHITYDGQPLNIDLLRKDLRKVNKHFHYYTNTLASCDIIKMTDITDLDMVDNMEYLYSSPEKTYRGLLYCTPTKLTKKEMDKLGLIEWN